VYERAIANVPPVQEKRFWKRYIYLWINYALFEELDAKDVNRARQVSFIDIHSFIHSEIYSFIHSFILSLIVMFFLIC
jgi:crooked neck